MKKETSTAVDTVGNHPRFPPLGPEYDWRAPRDASSAGEPDAGTNLNTLGSVRDLRTGVAATKDARTAMAEIMEDFIFAGWYLWYGIWSVVDGYRRLVEREDE